MSDQDNAELMAALEDLESLNMELETQLKDATRQLSNEAKARARAEQAADDAKVSHSLLALPACTGRL